MGVFDTLVDGSKKAQIKLFDCTLHTYEAGDEVPKDFGDNFTIVLPKREVARFALIKDGKFVKLTGNREETYPPFISKWGEPLNQIDDFRNPYAEMVKEFAKKHK